LRLIDDRFWLEAGGSRSSGKTRIQGAAASDKNMESISGEFYFLR
jgi:hypothetical protein